VVNATSHPLWNYHNYEGFTTADGVDWLGRLGAPR
jgi:hypothetical protein